MQELMKWLDLQIEAYNNSRCIIDDKEITTNLSYVMRDGLHLSDIIRVASILNLTRHIDERGGDSEYPYEVWCEYKGVRLYGLVKEVN